MIMRMGRVAGVCFAVSGLALVAACSQEQRDPPDPVEAPAPDEAPISGVAIAYDCESGESLWVVYGKDRTAGLTYEGKSYRLRPVTSGSGARYAGDQLEWWSATRDGREEGRLSRLDEEGRPQGIELERCVRKGQPLTPASNPQSMARTPSCAGPQLALDVEGSDAGAGNRGLVLSLRNAGTETCSITGYPGVTLMDEKGMAVVNVRADPWMQGDPAEPPHPVELAAGGKAYFDVGWNVVPHESEGETRCPVTRGLRVTAPGDTSPLTHALEMTVCGGRIKVGMVRATEDVSAGN
jgi:membrane-bound inhibitor of C-type lysozyme